MSLESSIKIISTFPLLHWNFLTTFSTLTALKRSASTLSIKHIRKFFDRPGNMTQEMLRWCWKKAYSPDQVKTSTFNDVCFFTKVRLIAGKSSRVDKHRVITFAVKTLTSSRNRRNHGNERSRSASEGFQLIYLDTLATWWWCHSPLHNLGWY